MQLTWNIVRHDSHVSLLRETWPEERKAVSRNPRVAYVKYLSREYYRFPRMRVLLSTIEDDVISTGMFIIYVSDEKDPRSCGCAADIAFTGDPGMAICSRSTPLSWSRGGPMC